MLNEDEYLERTPDLIAKVRKLREEAEKKMDRFTRVDDYDVRYVVGYGPEPAQASGEAVTAARPHQAAAGSTDDRNSVDCAPSDGAQDHVRGQS